MQGAASTPADTTLPIQDRRHWTEFVFWTAVKAKWLPGLATLGTCRVDAVNTPNQVCYEGPDRMALPQNGACLTAQLVVVQ